MSIEMPIQGLPNPLVPSDFTVYKVGSVYRATDGSSGTATTNDALHTLLSTIHGNLPTTGGRMHLKSGSYTLTGALNFWNKQFVDFTGDGAGTFISVDGATVNPVIEMADTTARSFINFRNMRFNSTSAGSGQCIDSQYFTLCKFENIWINDFNQGVSQGASTHYNEYENMRIKVQGASGYGISLPSTCNDNVVRKCRIQAGSDNEITGYVIGGQSNKLYDINCEGGASDPLIGLDIAATAHNTTVIGGYLEANKTNLRLASGVEAFRYFGVIIDGVTANITDSGAISPMFNAWMGNSSYDPYIRFPEQSGASDPTTTDIPNRQWCLWRTTTGGAVQLWYNNNGSLIKVTLS